MDYFVELANVPDVHDAITREQNRNVQSALDAKRLL
jgi:hypothetical protein